MSIMKNLAVASVLCLATAFFLQCSSQKKPMAEKAVATSALKPGDDFKATMDAYSKAKDPEAKIRLGLDFLQRNPNNQYTIGTIEYVVKNDFLEGKKDPEGAVRFALEHLANIKDEKLKLRADSALIRLYGKVGNKERLRELVAGIQTRRGLKLNDYMDVAEAAIEAKDWDFARIQCEALLQKNTPEAMRAEAGQEKQTDEQVQKSVGRNRGQALTLLGRTALELHDTKAALDHFAEAGKLARYDYAGLPSWPFEDLNLYWARALIRSGNPRAAMEKISKDAIIQGRKEAIEVLGEAHRAAAIEGTLQDYIDRTRPKVARTMPDFGAYDYDKKKVAYKELRGPVTLLAFWFPT